MALPIIGKKSLNHAFLFVNHWLISLYFWGTSRYYLDIFHKTEFHTVNLRCRAGLNLNWFKSCDTKIITIRLQSLSYPCSIFGLLKAVILFHISLQCRSLLWIHLPLCSGPLHSWPTACTGRPIRFWLCRHHLFWNGSTPGRWSL